MSINTIDPNEVLFGGGGQSAKFETFGDTITGQITDLKATQQTDFQTGTPKTWANGDPMMQVVVTLQTTLRDSSIADDDGLRKVYIKGKSLTDGTREAVRGAGAKGLEVGGTLTVTYVADGPKERGKNPAKLYKVAYEKPGPAAANAALGLDAPAPAAPTPTTGAVSPEALAAAVAALTPEQKAAMGIPA